MKIGVPREIKAAEFRVALTPGGVEALVRTGQELLVEREAGAGAGFPDRDYRRAGAKIVTAEEAWGCELVLKVKEPLPEEYRYLQGQMVFAFFHLAGAPRELLEVLLQSRTTAIAYETLEDEAGRLPILAPMSAIAGNVAVLEGAHFLARPCGGRGTMLGRVLGEGYGRVVVIGDGTVGRHAAERACALGCRVVLAGLDPSRTEDLARRFPDRFRFIVSRPERLASEISESDLVVGAVLQRGARAPVVVTEEMVKAMPKGAVVVDVSIDQGGCVATSRPTTHYDPVFERHGVIHYAVPNMPGAYPRTSTIALERATLPQLLRLTERGLETLCREDRGFAKAINTYRGWITCRAVAESWNLLDRYRPLFALLG